jgi:hypothetical protein
MLVPRWNQATEMRQIILGSATRGARAGAPAGVLVNE